MSYAQAAQVMGKTVKQITNMVYRGKKKACAGCWNGGDHKCGARGTVRGGETANCRRKAEETAPARQARYGSSCGGVLALLAGVSIAMPGMTAQLQPDSCTGFETAANMYGGSDALGYIIVGLLAFLFGCVHDHPVLPSAADGAGRERRGTAWS